MAVLHSFIRNMIKSKLANAARDRVRQRWDMRGTPWGSSLISLITRILRYIFRVTLFKHGGTHNSTTLQNETWHKLLFMSSKSHKSVCKHKHENMSSHPTVLTINECLVVALGFCSDWMWSFPYTNANTLQCFHITYINPGTRVSTRNII